MLDSWLNIWKFLSSQLGIPGALISVLCAYLVWQLKQERDDHKDTRKQVDALNDKRVELLTSYLKTLNDFKVSIDALTAIIGKNR